MPIRPADFLAVAESLHANAATSPGEPCDRTTVGRAYYACYLAIREAVRIAYSDPTFDVGHSPLHAALKRSADPDVADVGGRLETLFKWRSRADYRMGDPVSHVNAALMVSSAKAILRAVPTIQPKIPTGIPRKS